jgi:hypothetical protein
MGNQDVRCTEDNVIIEENIFRNFVLRGKSLILFLGTLIQNIPYTLLSKFNFISRNHSLKQTLRIPYYTRQITALLGTATDRQSQIFQTISFQSLQRATCFHFSLKAILSDKYEIIIMEVSS